MSEVDKIQQEQKRLIESLDTYYEKWSNSNFSQVIDRLGGIAKNLIEDNRKIDLSAKLFKKKLQQFSSSSANSDSKNDDDGIDEIDELDINDEPKNDTISFQEFSKTIRLYQKEIQNIIKRFNDTSEIINSLRDCLSNLPDIIPILTESIDFLKSKVQPQIDDLNSLREQINSLKTSDSQIESIENQIKEVKAKRDATIQKINEEAMNNIETKKTSQFKQIEESIELIQKQQTEIETQIKNVQIEIDDYEKKKIQLDSVEQENLKKFLDESGEIENELANLRSKLDDLKEVDLEKKVDDLRNELAQKNLELQQKQNLVSSLKAELNLRSVKISSSTDDQNLSLKSKSSSSIFLENEIEHLEEELAEKQNELDSLPSIEEWNEVSSSLKIFQSNINPKFSNFDLEFDPDDISNYEINLNKEIANIENKINFEKKEIVNIDSKLNFIDSQIEQHEKEIQRLKEQNKQIIENNDENAMINVLKIRKATLNDSLLQKENDLHNLQREQNLLDIRIKSLKEEKENLINYSTPSSSNQQYPSFLQPIQISNDFNRPLSSGTRRRRRKMKKIERKMINLTDFLLGTPKKAFFVFLYLLILIVFVFYMLL